MTLKADQKICFECPALDLESPTCVTNPPIPKVKPLVRMELTPEDIAYFRRLDHDRDRALAQGYTASNIPISEKHEMWLEFKKIERLLNGPQSAPAPGHEHAVAQFPSSQLATSMATPRSAFPNPEQNMMLNLLLGPAAQVSSKVHSFCTVQD